MSKQEKKGLVPELRFPEFRDAMEWADGQLITLSNEPLSNGVFNDPQKVGVGYKLINVSDMYTDTAIDEARLTLLKLSTSDFEASQVKHGDIFFTRSSLVKSGIAVSNIYLGSSNDVTFDGHLIRFRANTNKVIPLFAHYLFKTAPIRVQLIARGKSATMTTIGQKDVASVMLFYPEKAEQQKIADCLTSIDDLITAQTQKLDALKTHKTGLMQQLFPADGETVPKLRFPEFRDADAWVNKQLWEVADVNASGDLDSENYSPTKTDGHIYPIYSNSVSQEGLYGYCAYPKYQKNSVTITARGTLGVAFYRDHAYVAIGRLLVLSKLENVVPYFLQEIWNYSAKMPLENGGIPQLTAIKARAVELCMPEKDEQQKIADCLASVDELITVQAKNIESLKAHKKGLMQQLFPAMDEMDS